MTRGNVLVVGSNATRIEVQGGGTSPTGNYLNETVVPAMALIEAGYGLLGLSERFTTLSPPNTTFFRSERHSPSRDYTDTVSSMLAFPYVLALART